MAKTWEELRDSYGSPLRYLNDNYLNAGSPVPTNIPALDEILCGGLRPGMHVLGGEPGAGKSALGLFLSMTSAMAGANVFYASLEMGAGQCWDRCASCMSLTTGKPFRWGDTWALGAKARARQVNALRQGRVHEFVSHDLMEQDPMGMAVSALMERCPGLLIADSDTLHSIEDIEAAAAQAAPSGLSMLVVDYLQYVDAGDAASEYERVCTVSKRLNRLGVSLGIPVLALASMSRPGAKQGAPSMHSYKGSGDVEYNALSAWIIERGPEDADVRRLHVVKNRFGTVTGDAPVLLRFDGTHCSFELA